MTDGIYEVPGTEILGNVTVEANALAYRVINFVQGEGNTLTATTAYVITETATMSAK